jgi:dephospho-CoA kinase
MIIGLTGGMACGKFTLVEYLRKKGFIGYTFSDVITEELNKLGIPITRKSQQDLGNSLREEFGAGIWAKKLIEMIEPGKNYVIDGIRNPGEINELKKEKDFVLIAIESPQKLRFERIIARGMERDPKTWEEFLIADSRDFFDGNENGLNIRKCMEIADFTIINDSNYEEFINRFEETYKKITTD